MSLIYFDDLQRKEYEIPIITDKIIVDLVNLIQVNDDLICFRQKRGLFGQFFDDFTGADRKRQLATDENINIAMQSLHYRYCQSTATQSRRSRASDSEFRATS